MKKQLLAILTLLSLSINAYAISLPNAKEQGLVGEQQNGYLGVIRPGADINKLTTRINEQRRLDYQRVAKKQGMNINKVASIAGQKAIKATKKGQFYQNKKGKWVRK